MGNNSSVSRLSLSGGEYYGSRFSIGALYTVLKTKAEFSSKRWYILSKTSLRLRLLQIVTYLITLSVGIY
jgi:hypothetical protein